MKEIVKKLILNAQKTDKIQIMLLALLQYRHQYPLYIFILLSLYLAVEFNKICPSDTNSSFAANFDTILEYIK